MSSRGWGGTLTADTATAQVAKYPRTGVSQCRVVDHRGTLESQRCPTFCHSRSASLARQLILMRTELRVAVRQALSREHTGTPEPGSEPYQRNENREKSCGDFREKARDKVFCIVLYVCLGQTDRHSTNRMSLDERGYYHVT